MLYSARQKVQSFRNRLRGDERKIFERKVGRSSIFEELSSSFCPYIDPDWLISIG